MTATDRPGVGVAARAAYALVQGILGLFSAGALLYEAHTLFLRYYANEWRGVQISGVNGCAGEEAVANGDLFSGVTLCNKPENFVPWVEVYRHHPVAAAEYNGVAVLILLAIAGIWIAVQKKVVSSTPFGRAPVLPVAAENEHLR